MYCREDRRRRRIARERDHMEDINVDGKTTVKYILQQYGGIAWKHGTEPVVGYLKCWECPYSLRK
jgi:hypothetical protein